MVKKLSVILDPAYRFKVGDKVVCDNSELIVKPFNDKIDKDFIGKITSISGDVYAEIKTKKEGK